MDRIYHIPESLKELRDTNDYHGYTIKLQEAKKKKKIFKPGGRKNSEALIISDPFS